MSAATWWSITFNTPVQETGLAVAATTRETARGDQLLRTLRIQSESKWLQLKTWTFETPQTILQSSIKKCLSLYYQAYFMANLNLLHTWGGPPEQLLARQYHARPARAGGNTGRGTEHFKNNSIFGTILNSCKLKLKQHGGKSLRFCRKNHPIHCEQKIQLWTYLNRLLGKEQWRRGSDDAVPDVAKAVRRGIPQSCQGPFPNNSALNNELRVPFYNVFGNAISAIHHLRYRMMGMFMLMHLYIYMMFSRRWWKH